MNQYDRDQELINRGNPPMKVCCASTAIADLRPGAFISFATTGYSNFQVRAVPPETTRRCSYCNSLFETRAVKSNCENCGAPL